MPRTRRTSRFHRDVMVGRHAARLDDLRTAAYTLSIERVGQAYTEAGIHP